MVQKATVVLHQHYAIRKINWSAKQTGISCPQQTDTTVAVSSIIQ